MYRHGQYQADMRIHTKRALAYRARVDINCVRDLALCAWPASSPNLTVSDFFLWRKRQSLFFTKTKFVLHRDKVCSSLLSANIDYTKDRITIAINTVDRNMLKYVWDVFSYRLDVVRAASGDYIRHL